MGERGESPIRSCDGNLMKHATGHRPDAQVKSAFDNWAGEQNGRAFCVRSVSNLILALLLLITRILGYIYQYIRSLTYWAMYFVLFVIFWVFIYSDLNFLCLQVPT